MAVLRQATAAASGTTQTQQQPVLTLRPHTLVLRAEPAEERHIQWAEDVIDNEGLGRKSSKVCCIYHKPRAVDESSDDSSSSDSSSDDDSESDSGDDGRARPVGGSGKRGRKGDRHHNHDHDHDHGDEQKASGGGRGKAKKKAVRKRSPNAYEKMPKYGKKGDVISGSSSSRS